MIALSVCQICFHRSREISFEQLSATWKTPGRHMLQFLNPRQRTLYFRAKDNDI